MSSSAVISSSGSSSGSSSSRLSAPFWCMGMALLMSVVMTVLGIYRMHPQTLVLMQTLEKSALPHSQEGTTATTLSDGSNVLRHAAETNEASPQSQEKAKAHEKAKANENPNPKTPKSDKPLNIVLFYADDWTYKTLGAMGNSYVQTPVLDQLAKDGVLFTHNCVTTSICMQSRATLYTGQYSSTHKTLFSMRNLTMYEPGKWSQTLYPLMYNHGYHVGFVGKYHHLEPPPLPSFHFFRSSQKTHYPSRGDGTRHITEWNELDATKFLTKRPTDKPFFLTVSFFATHAEDGMAEDYRPMATSAHLYQDEPVPRPKTFTEEHWKKLPPFFHDQNFGRARFRGRYDTPEIHQDMMKKMYRMATEVDTACGNLMNILKQQGVYDNTLIIFTTDNGNFHGEHGLAEKWYAYEESLRVPLIVRDPRLPSSQQGRIQTDFTLSIDLAPTILSAAGVPVPTVMQGRDMSPLYLEASNDDTPLNPPWRTDFFYEFYYDIPYYIPHSVALVGQGFKYIYWMDHSYPQYFNLTHDPYEEDDIYNALHETALMEQVKRRLAELQTSVEQGLPQ